MKPNADVAILNTCPFCGGKAEMRSRPIYTYLKPYSPETAGCKYYVQCLVCATQCGANDYDSAQTAANAWNSRRGGPADEA